MTLKITVSASNPLHASADLLVVGVEEGARKKGLFSDLAKALGSGLTKDLKRADFSGKRGQVCEVTATGKVKAERVALVGLGDGASLSRAEVRRLAAKASRLANGHKLSSLALALGDIDVAGAIGAAAEGIVFGAYRFERYRTEESKSKFALDKVSLLIGGKVSQAERDEAGKGQRLADAVCIARDLINTPPNELYPELLAKAATEVAKKHKAAGLSCTVLTHKQLLDKGMVLIDAVGRGSSRGPRFIHMKYVPPASKRGGAKRGAKKAAKLKRLVFVGKGITFDTGGICIKPAPGMEEMKGDMGGAANVIALMAAVAVAQPNAEVHGLVASAENMPDGNSYRPGDIFGSYLGKTVEIINTDAEGRLVLADALAYGTELEPDVMIDNATLTGACVVALGPNVSGFYSMDDDLADSFAAAADKAGEATWRMPLVEDYREKLKSDWADVKHMGDRWGGSITAALFLREFVKDVPWVHVDIAGPSMADKSYDIYTKGGTGHCVLTYLEFIDAFIAS